MNEIEIVNYLQRIQRGIPDDRGKLRKLDKTARDQLHLRLKKTLLEHIRRGYQVPLCLGWYTALQLEDQHAKGNEFLAVHDTEHLPGNRAEATFAIAWSYDHLARLLPRQRREKYGSSNIDIALQRHFHNSNGEAVSTRTIDTAIQRYGPLVEALNKREFDPYSVSPPFARYAIEQVYIYNGVEDDDVFFEAVLEDGTLIQYLRDGHFHALNPIVDGVPVRPHLYASYEDLPPPGELHTRITYRNK